jgi:hypothetical protein
LSAGIGEAGSPARFHVEAGNRPVDPGGDAGGPDRPSGAEHDLGRIAGLGREALGQDAADLP